MIDTILPGNRPFSDHLEIGDAPAVDAPLERAEDYAENTVPAGGLILTAGMDVQHDRIAVIVRARGRDDFCDEIYGNTADKADPVWIALKKRVFDPRRP